MEEGYLHSLAVPDVRFASRDAGLSNVSDGTTYLCIGVKRFHKRLLSTEFVDEDSRGNHALGLVVWVFGSQFFFLFLAVAV